MRSFRHVFGMIKLSDADRARTRPPRGRSRRCNGDGPRSEVKAAGLLLAPLVVLLTLRMAVSGAVLRCADRREPRGAAGAVSDPGTTPYGGHAGPVVSVAYAPDGATLATVGSDGAWIWDARTGRQQQHLTGRDSRVLSLADSASRARSDFGKFDGRRWAHNPEVAGSNPAPATIETLVGASRA